MVEKNTWDPDALLEQIFREIGATAPEKNISCKQEHTRNIFYTVAKKRGVQASGKQKYHSSVKLDNKKNRSQSFWDTSKSRENGLDVHASNNDDLNIENRNAKLGYNPSESGEY